MAKISQTVFLLAAAICISFLASLVHCHNKAKAKADLVVIGRVYCDTCGYEFVTPVAEDVVGANVTLQCKDREGGQVIYTVYVVTDAKGVYEIPVKGDHAEELVLCFTVKHSTKFDCDELVMRKCRIELTDNGIVTPTIYVKPMGFLEKKTIRKVAICSISGSCQDSVGRLELEGVPK